MTRDRDWTEWILRGPSRCPLCVVGDPTTHLVGGLRPDALAVFQAGVEAATLSGAFAKCGGFNPEPGRSGFHLGAKDLGKGCVFHDRQRNVIFHTRQVETSHFPYGNPGRKPCAMDASHLFRANLLRLMAEKGLPAAQLSKQAGLNPRAVKDIEEGRVVSPKLSTVFALAKALGADPGEMIGLGPRTQVLPELQRFLAQYDADEQERLLQALSALPPKRA